MCSKLGAVKDGREGLDQGTKGWSMDRMWQALGTRRARVHRWWRQHQPSQEGRWWRCGTYRRLDTHLHWGWWRRRQSSQEGRKEHQPWWRLDTRRHQWESCLVRCAQGFANLVLKTKDRWFGALVFRTISNGFDRFGVENYGATDRQTRRGKA